MYPTGGHGIKDNHSHSLGCTDVCFDGLCLCLRTVVPFSALPFTFTVGMPVCCLSQHCSWETCISLILLFRKTDERNLPYEWCPYSHLYLIQIRLSEFIHLCTCLCAYVCVCECRCLRSAFGVFLSHSLPGNLSVCLPVYVCGCTCFHVHVVAGNVICLL